MKKLYVFRHGQTDWNKERRFQGLSDIPLNDEGRAQALALNKALAAHPIEHCLSSDLSRAYETAELALNGKNIVISKHPQLREQSGGVIEGKYLDEIQKEYGPTAWEAWLSNLAHHRDFSFPGGETNHGHTTKIQNFLNEELAALPYSHIAISTHGGALRKILWSCENNGHRGRIGNCTLFELSWSKGIFRYHQLLFEAS